MENKEITGKISKGFKVSEVKGKKSGHTRQRIAFGIQKDKKWYNFTIFADFCPDYIAPGKEVTVSFSEDQYNEEYKNYTIDVSMVRVNGEERFQGSKETKEGEIKESPTNYTEVVDPEMEEDYTSIKVKAHEKHLDMLIEKFGKEAVAQFFIGQSAHATLLKAIYDSK